MSRPCPAQGLLTEAAADVKLNNYTFMSKQTVEFSQSCTSPAALGHLTRPTIQRDRRMIWNSTAGAGFLFLTKSGIAPSLSNILSRAWFA